MPVESFMGSLIALSVLGKCENVMAAIHLIESYCLPTLMYGCEVWSISDNSLHTISVAWNNCFRRHKSYCCADEGIRVAAAQSSVYHL